MSIAYKVKGLLKGFLKSLTKKTKKKIRRSDLDHKRILEDCHDVRSMLCQRLIVHAKTNEERKRAEELLRRTQSDRKLIPFTIAKRRFLGI